MSATRRIDNCVRALALAEELSCDAPCLDVLAKRSDTACLDGEASRAKCATCRAHQLLLAVGDYMRKASRELAELIIHGTVAK